MFSIGVLPPLAIGNHITQPGSPALQLLGSVPAAHTPGAAALPLIWGTLLPCRSTIATGVPEPRFTQLSVGVCVGLAPPLKPLTPQSPPEASTCWPLM